MAEVLQGRTFSDFSSIVGIVRLEGQDQGFHHFGMFSVETQSGDQSLDLLVRILVLLENFLATFPGHDRGEHGAQNDC